MSQDTTVRAADPTLTRLADAILIPPFPGASVPRWILDALGRGLAGVTLFGQNISAPEQVRALTTALRAAATGGDPVIAIDEEGGDVTRVAYSDGSPYPGNAALGAVDDTALTRLVYHAIGTDLAALGINFDLAPCADVLGSADSPAVGTRSFGADTGLVSRHTAAAVDGLQGAPWSRPCSRHALIWSWWRWGCRCGVRRKAPLIWPRTARPGPAPTPPPSSSGSPSGVFS